MAEVVPFPEKKQSLMAQLQTGVTWSVKDILSVFMDLNRHAIPEGTIISAGWKIKPEGVMLEFKEKHDDDSSIRER